MAPQLYEVREPRRDWFEGTAWFDPSIDPITGQRRSHMDRAGKRLTDTFGGLPGLRSRNYNDRFPVVPRQPEMVYYENPHEDLAPPYASPQKSVRYVDGKPRIETRSRSATVESQPSKASKSAKRLSSLWLTRKVLGLKPEAPVREDHDEAEYSTYVWPRVRAALREPFSEFWGTFTLVLFGDAAVAQTLLSTGQSAAPGGNGFGNYLSISWGFGIGLMLGVYVAGDSGAFLNPAATFTNCLLRKLPWRRFPMYLVAQVMGAFTAAGVIYANYYSAINNYEGKGIRTVSPSPTATAGIFATYPQSFVTRANQFFSEFIGSAILMFVIFALQDDSNMGSAKGDKWFPLILFFLMFGISTCFGWQTGFAINPARDFGPRLMTYAVGYGNEVWTAGDNYFWVPIVAPFLGCASGGILYDVFIYTGVTPVNDKWFGFYNLIHPRQAYKQRHEKAVADGLV